VARKITNPRLQTRSARIPLPKRDEPYWAQIAPGHFIGYRAGAGRWIARYRDTTGRQHYRSLGAADDVLDADNQTIFDFGQAQALARAWFKRKTSELHGNIDAGPYTVADALRDYFAHRAHQGSKGREADLYASKARIEPYLGSVEVASLTTQRIRDWHKALETAPRLVRSKAKAETRATRPVDLDDDDALRARKATANRILTILKAALNHAFVERRVASDEAWRRVKPFREVDTAIVRYLTAAECLRLVNASEPGFRDLVRAALLTGCRYGELTRMVVADFDGRAGSVAVRLSKAGKKRHVALSREGLRLFETLTIGQPANALIFRRLDGTRWGASHQQRPLLEACSRAKISPPATFHVLRHTYASALAMKGVPMGVIAAQLGHSDTRMTEKHYAHLSPSYVAETVRTNMPDFGILASAENEVTPLVRARRT
jgi:integrase